MSTNAVSPVSIYQELQSFFQTRKSDLSQLGSALESGDLNAANTAYQALVTLGDGGPFANSATFRNSTREQDFQAIGQALQNGDLAGAQAAFTQLEATFNHKATAQSTSAEVTPAVIINIGAAASTAASTATATTSSTTSADTSSTSNGTTAASGPEVVINLGNTSGAAEQVTLNFSNNADGSEQLTVSASQGSGNPEQVTLNFAQNSNEQIVLNLMNTLASTTNTAQTSSISASA